MTQAQAKTSSFNLKKKISNAEWELRCDLAATYRLIALYGWDDLVFTHISLRCPDDNQEARFLINPFGLLFDQVTASNLVKVDVNGEKVDDTPYFANPAGFTIHSAIHMARDDAHCILHLHTEHGMAVAAQTQGLRRLTQHAMIVHADLAYHDYEGIALDHDERERLVADLSDKSNMILRNHGTLSVGRNCAEAFIRIFHLEKACKAQVLAQSHGDLIECAPAMAERVGAQASGEDFGAGMLKTLIWPNIMSMVRERSPGFDQ